MSDANGFADQAGATHASVVLCSSRIVYASTATRLLSGATPHWHCRLRDLDSSLQQAHELVVSENALAISVEIRQKASSFFLAHADSRPVNFMTNVHTSTFECIQELLKSNNTIIIE